MLRNRLLRCLACAAPLILALTLLPLSALALPEESDISLSAKNGSYQTGDTLSFSAAFSYDGAPNTPGSIEYRPVTWTVTNMNVGTCQYAAADQGLELTVSGNYMLLVTYNAYAYSGESGRYEILTGDRTIGAAFTVTDSVIPNTIDVTETGICFMVMIVGIVGAIICLAYLRRRVYCK